jgi:hypothetical protein
LKCFKVYFFLSSHLIYERLSCSNFHQDSGRSFSGRRRRRGCGGGGSSGGGGNSSGGGGKGRTLSTGSVLLFCLCPPSPSRVNTHPTFILSGPSVKGEREGSPLSLSSSVPLSFFLHSLLPSCLSPLSFLQDAPSSSLSLLLMSFPSLIYLSPPLNPFNSRSNNFKIKKYFFIILSKKLKKNSLQFKLKFSFTTKSNIFKTKM